MTDISGADGAPVGELFAADYGVKRGLSPAPAAKSGTRRYTLRFADGKQATMLDMQSEALDDLTRSVTAMFKPGYLISMTLQ